ncbi:MAG: GTPase RsgA [Planctomycetes bacterium]|nr:GTPase RsgA [Planctomycetota bacterium]
MKGTVLQARSGHFVVMQETGEKIEASARKKTMLASGRKSPVVVGDWVELAFHKDDSATIEKIYPRKNSIQRGSENRKGKLHTIVANVDSALLVFAADKPRSRIQAIDRYIVTAEYQHAEVFLVFNKWDRL